MPLTIVYNDTQEQVDDHARRMGTTVIIVPPTRPSARADTSSAHEGRAGDRDLPVETQNEDR